MFPGMKEEELVVAANVLDVTVKARSMVTSHEDYHNKRTVIIFAISIQNEVKRSHETISPRIYTQQA